MKYLILFVLIIAASCSHKGNDSGLEGVYASSFSDEFGTGDDTLTLEKANDGDGIYQIQKHLDVIKKLDGRIFPKKIHLETWTLDYDAEKQILTELKQGRILVWDSENKVLKLGRTRFKKIKDL